MDFFKSGFCNRKGPHNQGCLFRHDEIEGKGKIEAPPGANTAPRPLARLPTALAPRAGAERL